MAVPAAPPPAAAPSRAPRVRALVAVGRARRTRPACATGCSGAARHTRETHRHPRAAARVIARIRTDAGPARADVEYTVGWRVPRGLAPSSAALRFCVTTRVVSGPAGAQSCAPLRLPRPLRSSVRSALSGGLLSRTAAAPIRTSAGTRWGSV